MVQVLDQCWPHVLLALDSGIQCISMSFSYMWMHSLNWCPGNFALRGNTCQTIFKISPTRLWIRSLDTAKLVWCSWSRLLPFYISQESHKSMPEYQLTDVVPVLFAAPWPVSTFMSGWTDLNTLYTGDDMYIIYIHLVVICYPVLCALYITPKKVKEPGKSWNARSHFCFCRCDEVWSLLGLSFLVPFSSLGDRHHKMQPTRSTRMFLEMFLVFAACAILLYAVPYHPFPPKDLSRIRFGLQHHQQKRMWTSQTELAETSHQWPFWVWWDLLWTHVVARSKEGSGSGDRSWSHASKIMWFDAFDVILMWQNTCSRVFLQRLSNDSYGK